MEQEPAQDLSFSQVAAELSPSLLRYLGRYVGDRDLARDLLQETLIRIARALPGFEGRAEVRTWAFSIATRVAADYFRQPAHRLAIVEMAATEGLPDTERSPVLQLVIDEMNVCVRQVIDSLPEHYRAALVLHDIEGLTAEQTAEVCKCSLPAAKIRIHRARARLREALRGACDFYRDSDDVFRCDRKPCP
jgi:RNA polymerase sigma-70 factor (ECF subfamily)